MRCVVSKNLHLVSKEKCRKNKNEMKFHIPSSSPYTISKLSCAFPDIIHKLSKEATKIIPLERFGKVSLKEYYPSPQVHWYGRHEENWP